MTAARARSIARGRRATVACLAVAVLALPAHAQIISGVIACRADTSGPVVIHGRSSLPSGALLSVTAFDTAVRATVEARGTFSAVFAPARPLPVAELGADVRVTARFDRDVQTFGVMEAAGAGGALFARDERQLVRDPDAAAPDARMLDASFSVVVPPRVPIVKPAETALAMLPLPPSGNAYELSARFLVDSTGHGTLLAMMPGPSDTADARRARTTLASYRFRPAIGAGGAPTCATHETRLMNPGARRTDFSWIR